jgi:hypothetical protein
MSRCIPNVCDVPPLKYATALRPIELSIEPFIELS